MPSIPHPHSASVSRRRCLARAGVAAILTLTAGAASGAQAPAESLPSAGGREGRVIRERVNPYSFQPKEAESADGAPVSLRETFEALGPDAIEWYQHVQTLSNPWFEGRCPGSEGHERAVAYLAWWMRTIGLEPAFPPASAGESEGERSYFQPFGLSGTAAKVLSSTLSVGDRTFERDTDYIVAGASSSGSVTAPLAFAGYAIKEGLDGYTSFDGDDDLKGRIAILLRHAPLDADGNDLWAGKEGAPRIRMGNKIGDVVERGAAGVIVVNPPGAQGIDRELEDMRATRWGGQRGVPVMQLTVEDADALVRTADPQGRDLLALRRASDSGELTDFAMKPSVTVTMAAEIGDTTVPATNVGGILRGKGALQDEWVIVGGHLDHVGYGQFGTDPKNAGQLHPGADDNASGTAGVLVLARQMRERYDAAGDDANLRSVLFLCFSAEESGLDGSKHWVRNPTVPAQSVTAMLNMDMIGRLRNDELTVGGTGTAQELDAKLEPHFKASGLVVHADPSGRGPSDHQSFYNANLPVLFFFTGTHESYHRPGDKGHTVNPRGAVQVLDLVRSIVADLVDDERKLTFTSSEGTAGTDRGYASVRLGVQPSMSDDDMGGILVEAVSAGTSAEEAGIKPGDILFAWNGRELNGTADMMSRLREHRPGDEVVIALRRDGRDMDVTVKLKPSRRRE